MGITALASHRPDAQRNKNKTNSEALGKSKSAASPGLELLPDTISISTHYQRLKQPVAGALDDANASTATISLLWQSGLGLAASYSCCV